MKSQKPKQRICDYCNETAAILFCRADTARLCFSCDRQVHAANQLFSKHSRWQLCDVCGDSPASIFCETERSVLCQNCDWENHSFPGSNSHNRRPIEGFSGCPSVGEFVGIFGFDDLGNKNPILREEKEKEKGCCGNGDEGFFGSSGFDDELLDLFVWETPAIASLDELIVANDTNHGFRASDVPSVPKNRNASCGQRMEEILRQLRELASSDPAFTHGNQDPEAFKETNTHTLLPDQNLHPEIFEGIQFPSYESSEVVKWLGDTALDGNLRFVPSILQSNEENARVPDKVHSSMSQDHESHDEMSQNLVAVGNFPALTKSATHEINSQERDSALSRYKEKKKTRRFEKHIRYESRKIRAEGRTRIRGRFAKIE